MQVYIVFFLSLELNDIMLLCVFSKKYDVFLINIVAKYKIK